MIDLATPLAGLQKAETSLNRTASRIARAGSAQDQVDLSGEAVAMLSAKTAVRAKRQSPSH